MGRTSVFARRVPFCLTIPALFDTITLYFQQGGAVMALVEKNENLKGKSVKMDGLTISWDDEETEEAEEGLELELDESLAPKKVLKTKNDDLKTKKVII
jgi:hypothetical protein